MLANLLAHKLTHTVQYGRNSDLIPVENNKQQNTGSRDENIVPEAIMESLLEADCRAVQFVMALQNQPPAVLKTLEKQHIPVKGVPVLDKNQYTIWKLKHKNDNSSDMMKHQQAFREIFANILSSYMNIYEKYVFPNSDETAKIHINEAKGVMKFKNSKRGGAEK